MYIGLHSDRVTEFQKEPSASRPCYRPTIFTVHVQNRQLLVLVEKNGKQGWHCLPAVSKNDDIPSSHKNFKSVQLDLQCIFSKFNERPNIRDTLTLHLLFFNQEFLRVMCT